MSDNTNTQDQQPVPNPDLKSLERLVGRWTMSGDTQGTVIYEWMEGGFFLMQHFDFELYDHRVKRVFLKMGSRDKDRVNWADVLRPTQIPDLP